MVVGVYTVFSGMDMRVLMGGTEPRGSGVRSYYFLNRLREFSVFLNLSEVFLCSDLLEALILPGARQIPSEALGNLLFEIRGKYN